MTIYKFEGRIPNIGCTSCVRESVAIVGDGLTEEHYFIGAGATIRGDYGRMEIRNRTTVQENCAIHARHSDVRMIGNDDQVRHQSVLHNCTVKD